MKTITHFKWVHRRTMSLLMYVFIFMFSGLMHAQTLKTDNDVPALSACGDYEEFTLRIGYGVNPCPNASLEIVMPDHILYEVGSAKLGGVPLTESGATEAGATVIFPIPSGTITEELVITFNAKATCEAIETANLPIDQRPAVTYNLSGCGTATLTGDSEAINVRFAVLNLAIDPLATQGVIGDSFTRTITLQNSGNGYINEFTIERDLGDDLTLVSSDLPGTVDGWTVTETTPGTYVFSGSTLAPGATISFDETVEMTSCGNTNTEYDAYYGCTDRCTLSNVDDTKTAVITVDNSSRPVLSVSVQADKLGEGSTCFDQDYDVVWKITNTGTAPATDINLILGSHYSNNAQYGSTHITGNYAIADDADFTTNVDTPTTTNSGVYTSGYGDRFGTTGLPYHVKFQLPEDLAPGQTIYLRYTQRNNSPVIACESLPYRILYGSIIRISTSSYKNANACDDDASAYQTGSHTWRENGSTNFDGFNASTSAISNGETYNGLFKISNLYAEERWSYFKPGDYIDVVLEVSPSLAATLSNIVYSGNNSPVIIPDGPGKVRLRFEYGTAAWPLNTRLNNSGAQLNFQSVFECAAGSDAWYKVHMEVNRDECTSDPLMHKCYTYNPTTFCGPCEGGGLGNRTATVTRISDYGYVAQNPDTEGKPMFPLTQVDPETSTVPINTSFFMPGDVIEISQIGHTYVTSSSPVSEWIQGHFSFNVPNAFGFEEIPNSGKLIITRGADTYEITGLPVTMSGLNVAMDFDMALLHANGLPTSFTGFIDGDQLIASIQVAPHEAYPNSQGAVEFPTTYHFIHDGANYACAQGWRAVGVNGRLYTGIYRGTDPQNVTGCNQHRSYARFDALLNGSVRNNPMFANEYRQFIFPKKLVLNIPAGLSVDRVQMYIYEQGYTSNPVSYIDITPTTNGMVEIELEDLIMDALGTTTPTLDEAMRLDFNPRVTPTCESTGLQEIEIYLEYEAVIPHRQAGDINTNHPNPGTFESNRAYLGYYTDGDKISAQLTNPTVASTDGTASWVVQVTNSSDFRQFANIWLGGADIVSVQQVTSQAGTTTTGAPLTGTNGVYQIGSLPTMTTRYYRVTANVTGCDDGSVDIAFGHSCDGYPASVAEATCVTATMEANYTQVQANLQSQIVNQNPASARPLLCEALPYTIMVSNSGEGTAFDLLVSIPLTAAEGLTYVPGTLEITPAYSGATAPAFVSADDVNVTVTGGVSPMILISVPSDIAESLAFGERLQVKFELTSDGCEFRSGQRIGFYPGGINACGTRVENTAGVASNRVTIDGAPETEPTLTVQTETAEVNITQSEGDPLTAVYNFEFENTGDGVNDFVVDDTYGFNIKLPLGWEFVGDPQDLVNDALLNFVGLDPVKGYVYEFISDLTVGNSINIVDAEMVYTGDVALLDCEDDLGSIVASVYSVFTPNRDPSCGADPACNIEQVVLTSEVPMALPVIPTPTGEAEQEFCETQGATVADLDIDIDPSEYIIKWYDAETGGNELTDASPLATGTYYVYVALVDGATGCESDRLEVEVTISADVTASAGAEQELVNGTSFTMGGNQPTAPATGEWTFVSGTDADGTALTATDVTIADATAYNTTVEIPLGAEVVMKWTVTNGSCEAEDEVTITSALNTINAEDDDFSSIEINNEDGNANVGNVLLDNGNGTDTLGSDDATIANVTITVVTPATPVTPGANVPEIDPATGIVSVPANTPSGTYEIEYRICETAILPVENCDTAIVTVVVVDACSLEITCPAAVTVECGDSLDAADLGMPTIISSCGNTTVIYTDSALTGGCSSTTGTFTRTFTVTDENGNEETCTQEITVEDTTAPVLTGTAYAGITGVNACMADAETAAPFNADFAAQGYTDCSGDVTIALVDTDVTGTNCDWTVTYTFTVTDVCGNVLADQSYSNSGNDQTAPTLTGTAYEGATGINACRANAETAAPFDAALAVEGYTDNCGGDVTATLTGTNVTGTDCDWTVTYTFTITDACGNALTNQSYSNSGSDQTAPTLTGAAYTGVTGVNACMANAATAAPFNADLATQGYTDNCYGTVTATLTDTNVTGTDCAWEVTYTFTITDACGNALENQTYTNSGSDQTAPALTGTGYRGQTGINTCMPTVADAAAEFDADAAAQGYTDGCGGDLTITLENTEVAGTNCAWEVTYTFTVTDICGNSLPNQTYRNTGSDQTAPTLTGAAYAGVTDVNACMSNAATAAPFNANFAVQGYTDNCSGAVTATLTDTNVTGTDCAWEVTYTFTITDACGNALTNQTYTNSGSDQTAPALTGTPYAGQTGINACTADAVASAPFDAALAAQGYSDNCGGAITVTLTDTELTGDDCNWTVTYTYSVTDVCGNVLANQSYSNNGGNQGRPVITTNPQHSWTECGSDNAMDDYYAWLNNNGGATAESACGNDVTWSYWLEDTNTIVGYAGTVTVNFKATDACGNSTIRQATFAFVDTTPPTITQDPTNLVIECSIYGEDELNAWLSNFGNAQAEDTCGQVTWSHNYQGNLEVCGGAITVTFTATDEAGLQSTVTATVEVVDTIAPTLTVVAQPLTVQCGANTDQALNNWLVNHGGAEAIDNCATVTWTNDYDPANFVAACGNTGSVEVTFTGSDSCGNTVTTTATFTIEDTAAPTLVTPAQPQTAECGADAEAALLAWLANNGGATATDSCDADLTWTNDYNDGANFIAACGNTGEVTVTFTATDDCGNSVSTVAKFTIVDTTKPVFDINPQNVEAECDGAGNEAEYEAWLAAYAGAQASDNCGEVTYSYSLVDTAVLCGKTFSRTVRFTATDECGNRVSQQATFTIVDTTAPEFITEPEDVTVECDGAGNINDLNAWLNSYGGATAEDICSTEVKWSNNFRGLTTTCGGAGTAEVTFTATDACGNSSSRTATFTIVDTTAPEFVSELPSSEIFIRCEDLQPAETLKAADNCSDVTVVSYDEVVPSDCGDTKYQIVRTWVATDDCGNETTFTQTIHMSCQIEVFNAVTPNGDGYNDELELKGIECYPGNTVEIFNRWGVMVWSTQDYNSNGNTFNGYSNGRATISQDGMLPSGTYYYIIRYDYDLGNGSVYPIEQAGYLHLETNK